MSEPFTPAQKAALRQLFREEVQALGLVNSGAVIALVNQARDRGQIK